MSFCPVTRDTDDWMERNRERPWSGEVVIEFEDNGATERMTVDVTLDDVSDDEDEARKQIAEYVMERITITPKIKDRL